jgi:putative flippase GtrA
MIRFIKAQASSLLGTAVDFSVAVSMVEVFGLGYMLSSMTGNIWGAITQFTLARNFVFEKSKRSLGEQGFKYVLVWMGYLVGSALLLGALTGGLGLQFLISKIIVSLLMGFGYNYILQKNFVFA